MTGPGITDQPTVPDVRALWALVVLLSPEGVPLARWRICHADWDDLRRDATAVKAHAIEPPPYGGDPDSPWLLFGIPVDVIPNQRHRWPELVLISDRRSALPS
jgi:hypothetical protein